MMLDLSISVEYHAQWGPVGRAGFKIILSIFKEPDESLSRTRLGVISSAGHGPGQFYPGRSLPRAMTPDGFRISSNGKKEKYRN
jgi:hypothetical protein